jgi:transcriptional regulator with XRE-family HTH domain
LSDEDTFKTELGAKIRQMRLSKGYSGKQLASLSGVSQAYLSEVERGLSSISGQKLLGIAKALGIETEVLLTNAPLKADDSVRVPVGLSELAEELDLSYSVTKRLLESEGALMARRTSGVKRERTKEEWRNFYERVKDIIDLE